MLRNDLIQVLVLFQHPPGSVGPGGLFGECAWKGTGDIELHGKEITMESLLLILLLRFVNSILLCRIFSLILRRAIFISGVCLDKVLEPVRNARLDLSSVITTDQSSRFPLVIVQRLVLSIR